MAVTPVSLARISFTQRAYNLNESMRTNSLALYDVQNSLSTGLRFLQPSQDPLRSTATTTLMRELETLDNVLLNLQNVNAVLTEEESAAQEAIDILGEARGLTLEVIGDTTDPADRDSLTTVVDAMIQQLMTVANRKHLNTYLFAGHQNQPPFELSHGGVYYSGDGNRRTTIVENDLTQDTFTFAGTELFRAVSTEMSGVVDLDPVLTEDTLVSDLDGATGQGVTLGSIQVAVPGDTVEIDLSTAATLGDLVDMLNAELPAGMSARLGQRGIELIQGRGETQIKDLRGGQAARDLGLLGTSAVALRVGGDLNPRLTERTLIKSLGGGAGVDLSQSIFIRNGENQAEIDLSGVETMEELLDTINVNHESLGVWARIAADGRRLELVSRVSGTALQISENGGTTATALGIRTMHADTLLNDLNDGYGVRTVDGDDVRITTRSGATIDVDLSDAVTLQDVIDAINNAAGGLVTAGLAARGNGLAITDQTAGGGTLSLAALNESPVLGDLGLDAVAVGGVITGQDVAPMIVDSPFTALLELREGLVTNDRLTLQKAGQRIERVLEEMQRIQGRIAEQAQMMGERAERVETEQMTTQVLLSDVRDVDYTEATVRFQQLQMALQANLTTASKLMNLSLLDYL